MRQSLVIALVFGVGAGCSLIYNPSNLGQPDDAKIFNDTPVDVPPDVEVIMPVNPTELSLDEIFPMTVDEGRGTFGGRPALFVVRGTNFDGGSDAGLAVTLTPTDGGMPLTFTTTVAGDHNFIALQLTAPVDTTCEEGATHSYTVNVTENGATTQTIPNALVETCHDQLLTGSGSATTLATGAAKPLYSEVLVTNSLVISGSAPAIIQSAGGIEIDGTISANASGQTGIAGGSNGGGALSAGMGAGAGGTATLTGGGAGFSIHGNPATGTLTAGVGGSVVGDAAISSYAANYASGGGGGTLTAGGGGGGTIELTAHGDVTIGTVQVHGGPAAGGSGGAGAGGVIVVRALGGTAHGTISLDAAPGATGVAASPGRTRLDATTTSGVTSQFYGPAFGTPSLVSNQQDVTLTLTGQPLTLFNGYVETRKSTLTTFSFTTGPSTSYGTATQPITLTSGYNTVCVLASGTLSASTPDIAQNCIEMAFLP